MENNFKDCAIEVQYMFNDNDSKIDYDFISKDKIKPEPNRLIRAGLNKLGVCVTITDITDAVLTTNGTVDVTKLMTVAREKAYEYVFGLEEKIDDIISIIHYNQKF